MEQNLKSEGKCLYCGKTFAKSRITRHLQSHLKQKAEENASGQSYLVKIETNPNWGATPYFLSLWIDGKATMDYIDSFLRRIWLECCGHLSSFTNPQNRRNHGVLSFFMAEELLEQGKHEEYGKLMEEVKGEVPMTQKVSNVFHRGLKLNYEYDHGSSTDLVLHVVEEYAVKADRKIVLLSRNEPLELLCEICKKEPAAVTCVAHAWNEGCIFCAKCAKKQAKKCEEFNASAVLPIVNSPRSGVCAYTGGSIDKERDGIFVKKSESPESLK
jgi:hypothetical protein